MNQTLANTPSILQGHHILIAVGLSLFAVIGFLFLLYLANKKPEEEKK